MYPSIDARGNGPMTSAEQSVPSPNATILCTGPLFFVVCLCAQPASQSLHFRLPCGPFSLASLPDVAMSSIPSITSRVIVSSNVRSPQWLNESWANLRNTSSIFGRSAAECGFFFFRLCFAPRTARVIVPRLFVAVVFKLSAEDS